MWFFSCFLCFCLFCFCFFFSSRRRHTRWTGDWSSDVCSSDLRDALAVRLDGYVVTGLDGDLDQRATLVERRAGVERQRQVLDPHCIGDLVRVLSLPLD